MSAIFDEQLYLVQNPDVAAAIARGELANAAQHFQLYGQFENRAPSAFFDPQLYLAANPDVAAAVASGQIQSAFQHFQAFGIQESRNPSAFFDANFYLSSNPDIAAAVAAGQTTAFQHFLEFGLTEVRDTSPFFDIDAYLTANPDVAAAVNGGAISAYQHFVLYGFTEGRDLGNGITLAFFASDPQAQTAIAAGDFEALFARVAEVAPFVPGFQTPDGYTIPANQPLPQNFVPNEGQKLVVPEGVVVPPGTELPDSFEPPVVTPPVNPPVTPPVNPPTPQPDTTAPELTTSTPADDATGVAADANIVLNFSEAVVAGTGNIVITNAGDPNDTRTIAIGDASQVTISGSTVTINPTADLAFGGAYYVTYAAGVLKDAAGNNAPAVTDPATLNFTVASAPDTTPPTLTSSTPADDATGVAASADLVLNFSEAVVAGTGNIVITNAGDPNDTRTIAIGDASQVTISGSTVTINPTADLAFDGAYYVTYAAGVLKDAAGNNAPAVTDPATLNFTVASAPDTTPPTLTSSTPADDATGVAASADLVLNFSEAVVAGTGNIVITNAGDPNDTRTIAIGDASQVTISGSTVTINPTADLAFDGAYYVTYAAGVLKDAAGNNAPAVTDPATLNFTVASAPDTTPPTLTSSTPADNATGVAASADLVLNFSEAVVAGTGNIVITNAGDPNDTRTIAIGDASQVTISGSTVTINPTADLAFDGAYYVTYAAGVLKDAAGNNAPAVTDPATLNFTVASAPDTTPPTLTSSTPADDATGVAASADLVLNFSEAVVAGTGNIVITNAGDPNDTRTIAIGDASQVTISGSTVTINPTADLAFDGAYYVTYAAGVLKDAAGNNAPAVTDPATLNFTVASAPDTTPPTLTSSTPADDATGVAASADLVLNFSEAVVAGTGNIVITNAGDPNDTRTIAIGDASQVTISGSTVTINPTADLAFDGAYYVTYAAGVLKDAAGNNAPAVTDPATLNFTVASAPDTTPPTLTSSTPADDATGVAASADLVLNFSEAVVAGTGNIVITNAGDPNDTRTIAIGDASQVTISGSTVTINPTADLAFDGAYYVTYAAGVLKDAAGNNAPAVTDPATLNFTVASAPDTTPPTLTSSTPADDATGVAASADLVLNFSEAVVAGTGNIVITNAGDPNDTRTIAIGDASQVTISGSTVTINPTADLAFDGAYYVTYAAGVLKDAAGNNAPAVTDPATLNFTVASAPDTTPPTLTSSTPADNATGVAASADLVLNFSEAVVAGTGNIVITNAGDPNDTRTIAIGDASQVTISGSTVTINPTADLAFDGAYYVTYAAGVLKDAAGNNAPAVTDPATLNFTVASAPDTTPPTLTSSTPADNATGVAASADLVLNFSEAVVAGTGNITLTDRNNASNILTFNISDTSQVTISGSTVTINPTSDLVSGTWYALTYDTGVVADLAGNDVVGIVGYDVLDFTIA